MGRPFGYSDEPSERFGLEILAGAMRVYNRAVIGDGHTFGKGTVQVLIRYPTSLAP